MTKDRRNDKDNLPKKTTQEEQKKLKSLQKEDSPYVKLAIALEELSLEDSEPKNPNKDNISSDNK